jgi:sugar lactone lactonase YvrE
MRNMFRSHRNATRPASPAFALLAIVFLALAAIAPAHAQTVSSVALNQFTHETGVGSSASKILPYPGSDYGGTVEHIAANTRGDVFGNVSTGSNSSYVFEIPINGATNAYNLLNMTSSTYWGHSVFVDKANNIWVADSGDAAIIFIPFVNNAYPLNQGSGSNGISGIPNCSSFPIPANQTTDCKVPLGFPSSIGYYGQPSDVGMDAAGDLYVLVTYTSSGNYNYNDIILQYTPANTGSGSVINGTLPHDNNGQMAVTPAGDVFITASGGVYEYPHTAYQTPITIANMNNPSGVTSDLSGNIFVTQGGAGNIVEFPYISGAYNLNSPLDVAQVNSNTANGDTSSPSQGVAIDGFNRITVAGAYPNSLVFITLGTLQFGATPLATTSGSQSFNVIFNSPVTFGSFQVSGSANVFSVKSNTCSGAYVAGGNCSVSFTFAPTIVGTQTASLTALDSNGKVLATGILTGTGSAPTLTADPGTNVPDSTTFTAPVAVATDNNGNIFVADRSTGTIYKTTTGSTAAPTPVVTGLTSPSAVAVDDSENLFVAQSGSVLAYPWTAATSTYGAPYQLASGLSGPSALAIDAYDALYVADSGNGRVLRISASGIQPLGSLVTTLSSSFTTPVAVAVDTLGENVYVADSGTGSVLQINIISSQESTVLSGLATASGLAVDPSGTLYAVDSGATTITRLPYINGGLNPNFETTLQSVVKLPTAIAADSSGNLYVVDTQDGVLVTNNRAAGIVNFGNITAGQSSSVVAGQVSNSGNASLTLATPDYTASGATSSFAIQPSSTCAGGGTLTGGQSCTIAAIFSPQSYGTFTDTLALASSATNSASLALTGVGTPVLINTSLSLAVTSTGTPTFGKPVTITATLTPASNAPKSPTGSVTFYVDSVVQQPPVALNAAGTSASITLNNLSGGPHTITASYTGDYFYSSTSSGNLAVTVAQSSTTTTLVLVAPYTNPTSANPAAASNVQSQAITLTATVTPPISGTPTGTVTFYSGKTSLGTASVVPFTPSKGAAAEGQAYLTINTVATPLALGQYNITAVYSGDSNYTTSTSTPPASLLISAPTVGLSSSATTIIGGGAAISVTVSSIAGFTGTVDLNCTGLPAYSACAFSPAYENIAPGQSGTTLFQVSIDQPPPIAVGGASIAPTGKLGVMTLLLLLPSLLFGYTRLRHQRATRSLTILRLSAIAVFLMLSGFAATSLTGCSNSTATYTTPSGTTTLTINALASAASSGGSTPVPDPNPTPVASIQVQLTVK